MKNILSVFAMAALLASCSVSGTPLFVSPQPEVMGPEQMEALKKSFDIASKPQATCEPLDWMETRHPARWTLLGREVSFDWEHPEE